MEIKGFREIELEIGWFGGRALVAFIHEMGTRNLPIRKHLTEVANSFQFREYVNTNYMNNEFNKGIQNGMNALGNAFIEYYKNYVLASKVKPALSPKTIALKKRRGSKTPEVPLSCSGLMLKTIEYRINE
ncbi:hypothetical protein bhYOR_001567 (plasmid) [Borrelia nietonii YOR]|uniref:hypothetical protein n=1 Tax=Borrelia nietonii TaxID=3117462 RepID=UPI001FF26C7C|nr:hypothetical protein [Borrelia nietonii]UPA10176.1 hypothetical protein bhYOR_001567 [Borrelia nietonii YOR]